ncbi:MAG: DUF5808 domain-containing protein [Bryobacteraceae bacterium]
MLLALGALFHWLPLWRRENQYFGVTTPAGFERTPEGRRALRRFRIWLWLGTAVAIMLTAAATEAGWRPLAPAGTLVQTITVIAAFAVVHRQLTPYAIEPQPRTASLDPDRERLPGGLAAAMIPVAILAAAAIYVATHWELLPDRIPVHWGLDGRPNGWADRTPRGVAGPLVVGFMLWGVMLGSAIAILKGSPRPSGESADWTRRFRRANLRLLMALVWTMPLLFAGIAVRPVFEAQSITIPVWLITVAPLVAILAYTIPIIRLSRETGSGGDSTPDRCWYWGQFYYNRADPALMVEKRFGVGYTLNFANPVSWLFLAIPVAVVFGVRWLR